MSDAYHELTPARDATASGAADILIVTLAARVILLALASLAAAGVALGADRAQVRINAADRAAARAAVVLAGDLPRSQGWRGGSKRPDLSGSDLGCRGFSPKRSDLVVTGAAASAFQNRSGLSIESQAEVLRTRRMLQLDWQRTIGSPRLLPCLRTVFTREARSGSMRLVSLARMPFPRLGDYSAAYRLVMGAGAIRVVVDMVFVGEGRTELSLMAAAPFSGRAALVGAETRLARRLVACVRA